MEEPHIDGVRNRASSESAAGAMATALRGHANPAANCPHAHARPWAWHPTLPLQPNFCPHALVVQIGGTIALPVRHARGIDEDVEIHIFADPADRAVGEGKVHHPVGVLALVLTRMVIVALWAVDG